MLVVAILAMGRARHVDRRYLVMPLRSAPPLNTLPHHLDARHGAARNVRLFYRKAPTRNLPALLPTGSINLGQFNLPARQRHHARGRRHNHHRIATLARPYKARLAIRAVAQDEETARTMGINFTAIVLITFAIGSALPPSPVS